MASNAKLWCFHNYYKMNYWDADSLRHCFNEWRGMCHSRSLVSYDFSLKLRRPLWHCCWLLILKYNFLQYTDVYHAGVSPCQLLLHCHHHTNDGNTFSEQMKQESEYLHIGSITKCIMNISNNEVLILIYISHKLLSCKWFSTHNRYNQLRIEISSQSFLFPFFIWLQLFIYSI